MGVGALLAYKVVTGKSWSRAFLFMIAFIAANIVLTRLLFFNLDFTKLQVEDIALMLSTGFLFYLLIRYTTLFLIATFFGEAKNTGKLLITTIFFDVLLFILISYQFTQFGELLPYL